MSERMDPAAACGARIVAKAGMLATSEKQQKGAQVTPKLPDGPRLVPFEGPNLWALGEIIPAGPRGVTHIDCSGQEWSEKNSGRPGEGCHAQTVREENCANPKQHERSLLPAAMIIGAGT